MSVDQPHADVFHADVIGEFREAREEIVDLTRHLARLHLLLAQHGIEDPARANLSPRERRVLAEADERLAG